MDKHDTAVIMATQGHVDFLKTRLRESDVREIDAALGISGADGLQQAFDASPMCWTGLCDGEPVLIFGIGTSEYKTQGVPWLLASDGMSKVGIDVLRESKLYIRMMLKAYPYLTNYVDARQTVSIRWLAWCGFTIEAAEPWGVQGLPFHRFWMRREVCVL